MDTSKTYKVVLGTNVFENYLDMPNELRLEFLKKQLVIQKQVKDYEEASLVVLESQKQDGKYSTVVYKR